MGLLEFLRRLINPMPEEQFPSPASTRAAGGPTGRSHGVATPAPAPAFSAEPKPGAPATMTLDDDEEDDFMDENINDRRHMDGLDDANDAYANASLAPPNPKNRQELLNELKKNYSEVLGLVRKVDQHLDLQTRRSERLLELAEKNLQQMEVLPELAQQNGRIADSLQSLTQLTREGNEQARLRAEQVSKSTMDMLESAQRQTAALQQMQSAIHRSGEAELEMASSIDTFRGSLTQVADATGKLGETIVAMRESDAEREQELAQLVARGQRWLIGSVIGFGVLATAAVVLVLINTM